MAFTLCLRVAQATSKKQQNREQAFQYRGFFKPLVLKRQESLLLPSKKTVFNRSFAVGS